MKLMGVDVGFSKSRKTTGIACLDGDHLFLARAGSTWESRREQIPESFRPNVIAFDGPLLPRDNNELVRRRCETIFNRGPFSKRCKPGYSHWGFGLDLRRAAAEARTQFQQVLYDSKSLMGEFLVRAGGPIVEAFPNAFLGVLLPDVELMTAPRFNRGQRFDWLYEHAVQTGKLEPLFWQSLELPDIVWRQLRTQQDHELRAALICLLTAACAAQSISSMIGDDEGGWFCLPPSKLWQTWASEALRSAEETS